MPNVEEERKLTLGANAKEVTLVPAPSGRQPVVEGSFTAAGQVSEAYVYNGACDISAWRVYGTGTFQLERSFDAGVTYRKCPIANGFVDVWGLDTEAVLIGGAAGVLYRLRCVTATSDSNGQFQANYRIG